MKKRLLIAILCFSALSATILPSTSSHVYAANHSTARPAFLDKTRFVAHMGLAYYAFHHFVWTAYKKGEFNKGAPHRVTNLVKAALALIFAYHEASVAYGIAEKSNSKTLHLLVSPIKAMMNAFHSVAGRWKQGNFQTSDGTSLYNSVSNLTKAAMKSGVGAIPDIPVKIPGL